MSLFFSIYPVYSFLGLRFTVSSYLGTFIYKLAELPLITTVHLKTLKS